MPRPTFFKLADTKRKHFVAGAYKEFSHNSFEAASITNLVKSLGIAKGSVYQYFEDKDELYTYLVHDANKQLNHLLDKTCPYNGERFYDWYTKFLMVELKFLLSFPQFAILFQKLLAESSNQLKNLAQDIENNWLERISANLPASLYDSQINNKLLVRSPLMIFDMITTNLNLNKLIENEDSVYLNTKELVSVCSEWVEKLKNGL